MLPTLIFEEMRLPVQMLAAVLVFLCPCAKQRKHFKIRAAGGYLFIVLFSLLYFPVFGGKPAQRFYDFTAAWYALIALLAVIYAVLCFEVTCVMHCFFRSAHLLHRIWYIVFIIHLLHSLHFPCCVCICLCMY